MRHLRFTLLAALVALLILTLAGQLSPQTGLPTFSDISGWLTSGSEDHSANRWHPMNEGGEEHSLQINRVTEGHAPFPEILQFQLTAGAAAETDATKSWGVRRSLGSLDASRFDTLTFWVKTGTEENSTLALDLSFTFADPDKANNAVEGHAFLYDIGPEWVRVTVPLAKIRPVEHWRRVTGINLKVIQGKIDAPMVRSFSIKGLAFVRQTSPSAEAGTLSAYSEPQDLAARETPAEHRDRLRSRLVGWPSRMRVDPRTLPTDETALLTQLAKDTWRGIEALTDRKTGLPLDRIQFPSEGDDPAEAWIGDYTNITNIGFYLLSITAANELGFISRESALKLIETTLASLESVETREGFFYNYYNTTTLVRTDDLVSFVDSSWLTSGLMVARQAFPEIGARASRLIDQGNYRFFYDENNGLMSHGYNARLGQRLKIYYGVFYTEARLGSFIGIGKGDLPPQQWFDTARTMPAELTWQQGQPQDQKPRKASGYHWISGHYHWLDQDFVPSWGGSMFEALMPRLVLDEMKFAPNSLGKNGLAHTKLQRRYALEELHYPVWGMSPSSTPDGKGYLEYGVPKLGVGGYQPGAVTPHAAVLALMTEPAEATQNIVRIIQDFDAYGDYGLYDALDPLTGQVARNYLCLDQAMILIALANHLKSQSIQNYFSKDPISQRALNLLSIERF